MLPSNLNRFKTYLQYVADFDERQLAELLLILDNSRTRTEYIVIMEKLKPLNKARKPSVEVKEYMTTSARYMKKKLVITSYYEDPTFKYLLDKSIQRLKQEFGTGNFIMEVEPYPPVTTHTGRNRGLKISG